MVEVDRLLIRLDLQRLLGGGEVSPAVDLRLTHLVGSGDCIGLQGCLDIQVVLLVDGGHRILEHGAEDLVLAGGEGLGERPHPPELDFLAVFAR